MKTRIISGIVMVPLLLVIYFGGIPLAVATFLIGGMGVYELFNGFKKINIQPSLPIAWGMLILLYAIHFFLPGNRAAVLMWLVLSFVASSIYLFDLEKRRIEDAVATFVGIFYVEFLSYHMVMIDELGKGFLLWLVAITAFCTDIFAYFTGVFFGKKKLAPKLSPKKTIEGSLGGIAGAVVSTLILALIVKEPFFPHLLILGILASIMGQLGDLTASAFKRKMGIKDYGNLIPGHGGILDRFDSILFTSCTVFYYYSILVLK